MDVSGRMIIMKPIRSPIEEENFRVPEGWQSLERGEYCRAAKVEDFLKEIKKVVIKKIIWTRNFRSILL